MTTSISITRALLPTPAALLYAVDAKKFVAGTDLLASSCAIVAAQTGAVRVGWTATAFCVVSIDPPRLVVVLDDTEPAHAVILQSGALSVNVLRADQSALAQRFAQMASQQGGSQFGAGEWGAGIAGSPVLTTALAILECRIVELISSHGQVILLCEAVSVSVADTNLSPLISFNQHLMQLLPAPLQRVAPSWPLNGEAQPCI